ncbi:MAG: hypothetical protein M0C28_46295 [Candidatus Moduliflexus flocculans]|nr:hypothetical protein [Candidatus Moduliflexus flocculans]
MFLPFGLRFLEDKVYISQEPELGSERPGRRGAPGHRRDAHRGHRRGAPASRSERRRDPDARGSGGSRMPTVFGRLLALRFGERESRRIRFRPVGRGAAKEIAVPGVTAAETVRILGRDIPRQPSAGRSTSSLSGDRRPC